MGKLKYFIFIALSLFIILPMSVLASGSIAPSPRSLNITKGGTATFTITASNAVGMVEVYSSNSSIASVNVSSEWLENDSVTVTVTGVSVGTTSIVVKLSDAATFDEEELSGSHAVSVTVKEPTVNNNNENNNKPNNNNNNANNSNNSSGNNRPTINNNLNNNLSNNNNIKDLKVIGYELKKNDDNHYELTVNNNIKEVKLEGSTEDSTATITGLGTLKLEIGQNSFEVVVTSESGAKNIIKVKIIRKDGYYLEDIKYILKDDSIEDVGIIIDFEEKIDKETLELIKENKRNLDFNYYNDDKKLIYSWIIDGSKIKKVNEFNTKIEFSSEFVEEISELSNYSDGKYIHFEHSGDLPTGTKVKLLVDDKFKNDNLVNVYYYNKKTSNLELIDKDIVVKDGYIEIGLEHCSDYFITRSDLNIKDSSNNNLFVILIVIETIIIVTLIILDIINKNPLSKLSSKNRKNS